MTRAYITVDTEYSSGLYTGTGAVDRAENFARSIAGITPEGPAGITHKLHLLERFEQRATFFVDPMPALVWGVAAIEDMVAPILEAGQDVQLHCHTEWLELAGADNALRGRPLGERTGQHLKDFALEEQARILEYARDTLVAAGAPQPVAFRAGNYGANRDTLRALGALGIRYDSSHTPGIADGDCDLGLTSEDRQPLRHEGLIAVPTGCIATLTGGLRHAQVCALSLAEMRAAIRHARDHGDPAFVLVSHSFELLNRRTLAVNKVVRNRFEGLCRDLKKMRRVTTGTFRDDPPAIAEEPPADPLPASALRTGTRMAEQLVANTLYGAL